jgi:hypothetical protein
MAWRDDQIHVAPAMVAAVMKAFQSAYIKQPAPV